MANLGFGSMLAVSKAHTLSCLQMLGQLSNLRALFSSRLDILLLLRIKTNKERKRKKKER